jgi:hypothetical protein
MYVPFPPYCLIWSRGLQYKVIFAAKARSDGIASIKSFGEEHRYESGSRLAVIGVRNASSEEGEQFHYHSGRPLHKRTSQNDL